MSEVSCPHIHNQIPDRFYSSSSSIRVLPLFLSKTMSLAGHQTAIIRMKNEEGDQEQDDLAPSGTFPWRIENFSNLKFGKYASKIFTIGGIKWRVYMFLTDDDKSLGKRLALYLGVANAPSLPPGWTLFAHFRLTLVNQLDINKSVTKPTRGVYHKSKGAGKRKKWIGLVSNFQNSWISNTQLAMEHAKASSQRIQLPLYLEIIGCNLINKLLQSMEKEENIQTWLSI
ncbi:putative ubiquitinyl hydrolase 1 [Rosa chinensis]|uniref:Putative ubiquitinyl hydrolase 1 n=1 Tax=Rosa chinensis TaxID=74649 RepID=A0A2P6SB60_ROSCH|nr:putative ubiquitinyl hydrolase 1 [Rosa chinensis]